MTVSFIKTILIKNLKRTINKQSERGSSSNGKLIWMNSRLYIIWSLLRSKKNSPYRAPTELQHGVEVATFLLLSIAALAYQRSNHRSMIWIIWYTWIQRKISRNYFDILLECSVVRETCFAGINVSKQCSVLYDIFHCGSLRKLCNKSLCSVIYCSLWHMVESDLLRDWE